MYGFVLGSETAQPREFEGQQVIGGRLPRAEGDPKLLRL
jgi:hypothetical protein